MANNEQIAKLCQELQSLKVAVDGLAAKMEAMTDSVSVMEKTVRMVLIANWDQLAAFQGQPPPPIPSPPREGGSD